MQLNRARFALNNNCGYVLQAPPPVLPRRSLALEESSLEVWPPCGLASPEKLRVVVLSADHLPKREGERCCREEWDDLEVRCWRPTARLAGRATHRTHAGCPRHYGMLTSR